MDNGDIISTYFPDTQKESIWTNVQIKKNLKEGEDYMLVDSDIHNYWVIKYGKANEVKRFGIKDENGENVVEIYLKQFNIYPIPN